MSNQAVGNRKLAFKIGFLGLTLGLLFSLAFLILPGNASAQSESRNSCSTGNTTVIYFVNGVWNTLAQARAGQNLLKDAYQSSLESAYPDQKFEFKLAYNFSSGKLSDVIEVIGQKMNEINDPSVDQMTAAQYFQLYMTAKIFGDRVAPAAKPIAATIQEYLAGRITDRVNSASHIQKYQSDLQEGKRVLLVAHSQGNMFANQAVSVLMGEYGDSLGLIGVASPAAFTVNNSPYYTAHDDRVIDALRIIHDVLPSNIENDPGIFNDPRDFSNHQFKESYFTPGLLSRTLIDADVNSYMANLKFPSAQLGSGAITVTLTWGDEPDVDLHVTEPNGTHVYYEAMQGTSGFLDLDDVSSFGPEHYFVACETLQSGVYRIGVNYFEGFAPETAQVQVSTGDGNTRTFSRNLSVAVGSDGNNSPFTVAIVTVDQDSSGNYSYDVN